MAGVAETLEALAALCAARAVTGMPAASLVAVNEAFGALRRWVDAGHAEVAAEIARQSRAELGRDSLARKCGFRSPAAMISATTGVSVGAGVKLIVVGEGTALRTSLTGEVLPSSHPHVREALRAGRIGVEAAAEVVRMLDRVSPRADAEAKEQMERMLAEAAPGLTSEQLRTLLSRAEAVLDPDGVEPREEERRADRSLLIREDRGGMTVLSARLDPATAALRRNEACADEALRDARSLTQMRADALAELCRHGLGCRQAPTGAGTTIVVRMSLEDLERRTGIARIDGVRQPVSATAVRRMAADAQVIPWALGGDGEILDWGRAKRLFTRAQKLALVERDGGCAFCGAPPGQTVVHHIRWWERDTGPTDLDNGVLLCTSCHHRVHDDGWEIRVEGTGTTARVVFIPPAWLDPARTPRCGGRARYDVAA